MNTQIASSVTDDLIAEIERASNFTNRFMVEVQPGSLALLLAERAELKRDAERYRWLSIQMDTSDVYPVGKYADKNGGTGDFYGSKPDLDAAIDAAMQS